MTTDQRGEPRIVNGNVDIGAVESQGYTLTPASGSTPQTALNGTAFTNPLAVTVTPNDANDPVNGGVITFTAPTSGAVGDAVGGLGHDRRWRRVGDRHGQRHGWRVHRDRDGHRRRGRGLVQHDEHQQPGREEPHRHTRHWRDRPTPGDRLRGDAWWEPDHHLRPGHRNDQLGMGLTIESNVTIDGPGASTLTVSGGGPSSNFSVFTVNYGVTASMSGPVAR